MAEHEKKLQSEHAADDIRADELVKITQREAKENGEHLRDIPVTNRNYWRFRGEDAAPPAAARHQVGYRGLIVLFIGGFVVSYFLVKREVAATIASRVVTLQAGVEDLQNLDPQSAAQEFSSLNAATSSAGIWGRSSLCLVEQRRDSVIHRPFRPADDAFKQYGEHRE